MNKKILALLIALVLIATPLVMIASSTDAYAHPGGGGQGGGNQGGGGNNGGGGNDNGNGGGNQGGNNNGGGNGNGGGGNNNGNGGNNGNGNNNGDDNGEDEGNCEPSTPVDTSGKGWSGGQMVPRCPVCKLELNYTDNIRAYWWTGLQGGEITRQFYLCPKCGFNNAVDKNGIVILDLNTYQIKLQNYKKPSGATFVPDYDLFRYDMPKQSYPVSLPYMK